MESTTASVFDRRAKTAAFRRASSAANDAAAMVASLTLVHVLHRHKLKKDETALVLYFKAARFRGEPASLEPKKFKDVHWLPIDDLPSDVSKPTLHVLNGIKKNMVYSEFPSRSKALQFWEEFGNRWAAGFSDFWDIENETSIKKQKMFCF